MYPLVTLHREYKKSATLGTLVLPSGRELKTIERPWLNNARRVSCYPEGAYIVKYLPRSGSGKYKRVWHVQNVPNRSGILFHGGNFVRHSLGCTIVGSRHGWLSKTLAVLGSKIGLDVMREELEGKDFILIVTSKGQ
jgi:hypothetical protein